MFKIYSLVVLFVYSTGFLFSQTDSLVKSGLEKQKAGDFEMAIMIFTQSIQKHEPEVKTHLKKWDEYKKLSEFEKAEITEPPFINTQYAIPYYLRGQSYVSMKNTNSALDDFTTALKINSKYASAYYERGKLLWTTGKKYEGCYNFRQARTYGDTLAKDMFDEKFCWNEALLLSKEATTKLKLNQFDEALALIQKAIQLSPDTIAYYLLRGQCYYGLGKIDSAFTDLNKAITKLPNNLDAYFTRGLAYYSKKKYQEAFIDFDNVIRIDQRFANGYLYRAYSCEGMNKVQSALFDYAQVQRLKPHDPLAYYKSGLLKNENKDTEGACVDFKKAAALGSTEAADYAKSCK